MLIDLLHFRRRLGDPGSTESLAKAQSVGNTLLDILATNVVHIVRKFLALSGRNFCACAILNFLRFLKFRPHISTQSRETDAKYTLCHSLFDELTLLMIQSISFFPCGFISRFWC